MNKYRLSGFIILITLAFLVVKFIPASADDKTKQPNLLPFDSRPGYRPEVTPASMEFYKHIMEKLSRGENTTSMENLTIAFMIAQRRWPEPPEPSEKDLYLRRYIENHPTITTNVIEMGNSMGGKLDYDREPKGDMKKFVDWYNSTPRGERPYMAEVMMGYYRSQGLDTRSQEQKEHEKKQKDMEEERLREKERDEQRRKEKAEREEEERLKAEQKWREEAAAHDRLVEKIKESKEEKPTTKKDWGQMTPAERRDALKSNDPQAWENLKNELLGKSNPSENADKISGLKNSETQTDQKDRSNNQDPEGKKAGMDLAKNTNLTDSYQKDRSDKSSKETQQTQTTAGSTLSEKKVASHARDLEEQSQTTAQGKLTETAISQTQQESTQAQKIDQLEKNTAIGTILVGSLLGGLTSGVAIGLDSAFGTLGRGAGEQASISTGIQPKPEPVSPPTPTPTSTTTPAPTSTHGSTPDCSAYRSSAQNLTASYTSGSMATSAYKSQMAVLRTKYKDCNETTEPPKTSVTSTTSTQGSTPDCSAYRSSANALDVSVTRGSMSLSDYKSQMAVLMSKYKGCTGAAGAAAAGVAITPPITPNPPPVTPKETKPPPKKGTDDGWGYIEY